MNFSYGRQTSKLYKGTSEAVYDVDENVP